MQLLLTTVVACILSSISSIEAFAPIASHRVSLSRKTSRQPWTSVSQSSIRAPQKRMQLKMAAYPVLDDWAFSITGGIRGTVTKSPSPALKIGELITTSKIVTNRSNVVAGTIVETSSGSRYILGTKKFVGGRVDKKDVQAVAYVPIPTIQFWSLTSDGEITGSVTNYDGDNFAEGEQITTSLILNKSGLRNGSIVTTSSGSKYRLGKKEVSRTVAIEEPPKKKKRPAPFGSVGRGVKKGVGRDQQVTVQAPAQKKKRPAPFGSVGRGVKKGVGRDQQVTVQAPAQKKKRPAPFGSVGRGANKGAGRAKDIVPVLNQWSVNNRDQVVGIISRSPDANEKDGKRFTTGEVATNMAFVEEGFTVMTVDDRKFLLGEPKGGSKKDYDDEMADYVTPSLNNWDVDAGLKITGVVKGNVPDGILFTTDQVISDSEFIDDGFTICTESGLMYKLGKRQKGKNVSGAAPAPIATASAATPKVSSKKQEVDSVDDNIAASGQSTQQPKKKSPILEKRAPIFKTQSPGPRKKPLPILDEWVVTAFGGVSGTVTNSPFPNVEDGETLATSKLEDTIESIRPGNTVLTVNGSQYVLGTKKAVNAPIESPPTPILAGVWVIAVLIFVALTD